MANSGSVALALLFVAVSVFSLARRLRRKATHTAHGRCVLITGCDSGFGQGLARAATDAGYTVVAACFTKAGAHSLKDTAAATVVADLTTAEGIAKVAEATKASSGEGGLYALVNNAGLCLPGLCEWLPMRAYELSMSLMFHAPVALIYELLPSLKAARGRVINVTSVDGFLPLPNTAAYTSAKHALEAFSDILRCEMLPWGVQVSPLHPETRTPLLCTLPIPCQAVSMRSL